MVLEQELKLTARDAAALDRVLESSAVHEHTIAGSERPSRRFYATYYDTPDRKLERLQWSLRVRREGSRWKASLKTRGAMVDGVSSREEFEEPVSGWIAVVGELPPGDLRAKVSQALDEDDLLEPRVIVDVMRSTRDLDLGGAVAELVTDRGVITAGGRSVELYEVELELRSGDFGLLDAFGRRLADEYGLNPSLVSKQEIGIELLRS
ncbi:MAG: CYTH domain-containing protein [Pseudomonadota bacterium]|nr:CYTH domain-containing protein [Pseudomonadota bacterium]